MNQFCGRWACYQLHLTGQEVGGFELLRSFVGDLESRLKTNFEEYVSRFYIYICRYLASRAVNLDNKGERLRDLRLRKLPFLNRLYNYLFGFFFSKKPFILLYFKHSLRLIIIKAWRFLPNWNKLGNIFTWLSFHWFFWHLFLDSRLFQNSELLFEWQEEREYYGCLLTLNITYERLLSLSLWTAQYGVESYYQHIWWMNQA